MIGPNPHQVTDGNSAASYAWLDAVRAIAAIAVVLNHARDFLMKDFSGDVFWAPFFFVSGCGTQAVLIFFVLSGFWISKSVSSRLSYPHFWKSYLFARLTRLWLVLIPVLLIGGSLDYFGASMLRLPFYRAGSTHSLPPFDMTWLHPKVLFGNLIFLQTIAVDCFGSNKPLWSLSCEFRFYIWYPALLRAFNGKWSLYLTSLAILLIYPGMILYFCIWLFGVIVRFADRNPKVLQHMQIFPRISLTGSLMAFIVTLVCAKLWDNALSKISLGLGFSILMIVLLNYPPNLRSPMRLLSNYGRRASYSLYVLHFPLLVFFVAFSAIPRAYPNLGSALVVVSITVFLALIAWVFASVTEAHTEHVRQAIKRKSNWLLRSKTSPIGRF